MRASRFFFSSSLAPMPFAGAEDASRLFPRSRMDARDVFFALVACALWNRSASASKAPRRWCGWCGSGGPREPCSSSTCTCTSRRSYRRSRAQSRGFARTRNIPKTKTRFFERTAVDFVAMIVYRYVVTDRELASITSPRAIAAVERTPHCAAESSIPDPPHWGGCCCCW